MDHPLKIWLRGKSKKDFAAEIGIDYRRLWRYSLPCVDPRYTVPDRATVQRIYEATDGAISGDHFYGHQTEPNWALSDRLRQGDIEDYLAQHTGHDYFSGTN